MAFEGYDAFDDPTVYKGTAVLKNRLGIRDAATLEAFELEMTTLRAAEGLPEGRFTASHYCRVHHHLFQDVYRWAGRYRSVQTAKGGNLFCRPEFIAGQMQQLFDQLGRNERLAGLTFEKFAQGAASFLATLNAIHPFREGNGRSQLSFLHVLAIEAGHPLALRRVSRATFLPAMIASFAGDEHPLIAELLGLAA